MTTPLMDAHLIGLTAPDSPAFEAYLVLRLAIERAQMSRQLSVVAVTSPTVGDGKTTTSINVAAALALNPRSRVLLIDADLRMPSVARQMGTLPVPGLADLLLAPARTLAGAVSVDRDSNLAVLTAGHLGSVNPYDLFHAPRFAALIAEARSAYDYVVVDTPPVIPVADCGVIAAHVDAFLVVVTAHRTPRRLLSETLTRLGPDKTLGLVFNGTDRPFRGAYYGYPGYAPRHAEVRA